MRIALLAPLWKTVPPQKYGGSELVVANLAQGLVQLGHTVTTFACGGSTVSGDLIPVIPKPMYELVQGFNWNAIQPYEFLSYAALGERIGEFDVVHNHMGFHPLALARFSSVPFVTTLHSSIPPDFPYLADAFRAQSYVSISDAQRILAPQLHYVATVHHGIDTDAFMPRTEGEGNGFVFLGTLSKNKGIDVAVRTAHALNKPLVIAGEIREDDRAFLEEEVFPLVDGERIRFVGEVDHTEKAALLRAADALLFPTQWNEAFGLVMIEALACGTPVVALHHGAVPEVLQDGVTGYIVDDEASFVKVASRVHTLSRTSCRKDAEQRFDLSVMAQKYVDIYRKIISSV